MGLELEKTSGRMAGVRMHKLYSSGTGASEEVSSHRRTAQALGVPQELPSSPLYECLDVKHVGNQDNLREALGQWPFGCQFRPSRVVFTAWPPLFRHRI